jgi:secreted trypsin-like serine protease
MKKVIAALIPLLLASCGPTEQESTSSVKVFGGRASEDGEWSSSVAILRGGSTFCTGTVVHPRLVITAAHCVTNSQSDSGSSIRIGVGKHERTAKTYAVERVKLYPGYVDDAITDIAYLRLAQPVENVEIIPPLTDKSEIETLLAQGAKSVLVGFGQTNTGLIGIKHQVETFVGRPELGALFIGGNGKDTCQGDSGGPAYGRLPNGEWRVYGITSRGNGCSGGGTYARMHDQICWIQKDSGITIPGVKTDCSGIEKIEVRTPRQIYFAVGGTDDAPTIAIGADIEVKSAAICKGNFDVCRKTLAKDIALTPATTRAAEKTAIFKTQASPDSLSETFTLMGFDQYGNLIASNPIRLEKK